MKCCYPSKFHYESIGDGNIETIQSTCPAVDSYNSQQGAASAPQVDPNSCDAHRSEGYECVPFYQCEDGEIIDDGAGLLDIRSASTNSRLCSPNQHDYLIKRIRSNEPNIAF